MTKLTIQQKNTIDRLNILAWKAKECTEVGLLCEYDNLYGWVKPVNNNDPILIYCGTEQEVENYIVGQTWDNIVNPWGHTISIFGGK